MNRTYLAFVAAVVLLTLSAESSSAQVPTQRGMPSPLGPTVSPYLNLLRGGNSTALNYYGLVRPQVDTIAGFQGVRQQFNQLNAATRFPAPQQDDGFATGTGASFMNYGGYFMTTNAGPSSPRLSPPAGRSAPTPPSRPVRR